MTTRNDIRSHVIGYFAWRFNAQPWEFNDDTEVRKRFKSDGDWEALADTFNNSEWMADLGVLISHQDMGAEKTIGGVTDLIYGKI